MRYLLAAMLTFTLAFVPAANAEAGSKCTSTWQKFTKGLEKWGPMLAKMGCGLANEEDADAAAKCQEDIDKAIKEVEKGIKQWNKNFPMKQGTIGPRGLAANGSWATGNLKAERLFIGKPVVDSNVQVKFKATGGKYKKDYTVRVCFMDLASGRDKKVYNFKGSNSKKSFTKSFTGMVGMVPAVFLKKKPGLSGLKYKVSVKQSGGKFKAGGSKGKPRARKATKTSSRKKSKSSKKSKRSKRSKKSKKSKKRRR